uniref:Cytochrome p450 CYP3045C19 n=1 Tax=Brachionus calyciflorus TaxID=104777 RepID=A0A2H4PSI0_9BILA|nr:cytochrome p450 CYP3045C19 [Brachionus calyciflorus]
MDLKSFTSSKYQNLKTIITNYDLNEFIKLDSATFLKLAGSSLIGLGIIYLFKIWYSYRIFKRLGVKHVNYNFFYGNYKELLERKSNSNLIREWSEKYGKTYGYFEGHMPILVTGDLDIIQEIFIKQHSNFSAKKKRIVAASDDHPSVNLINSVGLRWKRMRNIMNPTFSSAKMRELSPDLVKCTDRLIEILENEQEKEINITNFLKRFTMDSIWNCAFGVDANIQYNPDNEYFVKCEKTFQLLGKPDNLPTLIGMYFHEFRSITFSIMNLMNKFLSKFIDMGSRVPTFWFMNRVFQIVDKRKADGIRKRDYLQLLIDAEGHDFKDEKLTDKNFTNFHIEKKMTIDEIKTNVTLFMFAGYETTSTMLSFSIHTLAKYQDQQKRVHEEIKSFFDSEPDSTIDSDSVQKLEYLDLFIKEVMRFYPIGPMTRRCTKETNVKGINIPKDLVIAVDTLSIHFDAENWGPVDPNEFYPERFSKETKRHPCAFMGFGAGPRNCIGMKFALIELKIALCKLILKYEFLPLPEDKQEVEIYEMFIRTPKDGVSATFRKRKD